MHKCDIESVGRLGFRYLVTGYEQAAVFSYYAEKLVKREDLSDSRPTPDATKLFGKESVVAPAVAQNHRLSIAGGLSSSRRRNT